MLQGAKRLQLPAESTTDTKMVRSVPPTGTEVRVGVKGDGNLQSKLYSLRPHLSLRNKQKVQDSSKLPLVSGLKYGDCVDPTEIRSQEKFVFLASLSGF